MPPVSEFHELRVYSLAFEAAMRIFDLTKSWPKDERYSLTDQIRRSSRSVCANVAEAWRKRLHVGSFISKLSDANAEAGETIVWLNFALKCGYMSEAAYTDLAGHYNQVTGSLIKMISNPDPWCGPASVRDEAEPYNPGLPE